MTEPDAGTRAGRGPLLVLAGSVALLVAILAIAVGSATSRPGPGGEAARLVPAGALAFVRLSTDPEDPAARRLQRLAPRIPGYLALRDAALTAVSPAPGAFDPRRDVRPWLGDEAAVALVDVGGGRFGSLVLARVRSRPRAEALLQRVAGPQPGVRYRGVIVRRFAGSAAAFVGGFLVAGPEAAVRSSIDVMRDAAPALADAPGFERALDGGAEPLTAYASPRGLRSLAGGRGAVVAGVAALLDHPALRAAGAAVRADARGLRARVRRVGTKGTEGRLRLLDRVPADAAAVVAGASLAAAAQPVLRAGGSELVGALRRPLQGLDLSVDRDLLGRLDGEYAAWVSPGEGTPVITLAAHTRDPRGTRETLARLQQPLVDALPVDASAVAGEPPLEPAFEPRTIAGLEAFTVVVNETFAPTYAVTGNTVLLSTSPDGIEAFRARGPRLRAGRAFRAALPRVPARVESLAFVDVRRLLALGEQTGLALDELRPVSAAAAIAEREEDGATTSLSVAIP